MSSFRKRRQSGEMSGDAEEKEQLNCLYPRNELDSVVLFQEGSILCGRQVLLTRPRPRKCDWRLCGLFLPPSVCPDAGLSHTSCCGSHVILLGPRAYLRVFLRLIACRGIP